MAQPYSRFYALLVEDEDARVCRDIPDSACDDQPEAFTRQLLAQTLTKLGDALTSSRLVLAWMLASLSAPVFYISLLVPLRESLSLLPQLLIAQAMREHPLRKGFWVAGSVLQAVALLGMVPAVLLLQGHALGLAVTGLLALFSLARGVCSVAAKDVLGKTVSKSRRGRLTGFAGSAAGLVTLAVAAALMLGSYSSGVSGSAGDSGLFAGLLAASAGAWLLAAWIYAGVPEAPGATEGGGNAFHEAVRSLGLLASDRQFRDFVIARILLVATAFAIPYVVLLLRGAGSGGGFSLGSMMLAEGLAALLSAPLWGHWSDAAAHRVMAAAALVSVLTLGFALGLHTVLPSLLGDTHMGALLIFLAAVAHQGARIGRKTYLVDMATSENRASYTAVSNTVLGLVLFSGALLGVVDVYFGTRAVLYLLAGIGALAVVRCLALPRVD